MVNKYLNNSAYIDNICISFCIWCIASWSIRPTKKLFIAMKHGSRHGFHLLKGSKCIDK